MDATARQDRETADYSLSSAVNHPLSSLGDSFPAKDNKQRAFARVHPARRLFKHGGGDLCSRISGKLQSDI